MPPFLERNAGCCGLARPSDAEAPSAISLTRGDEARGTSVPFLTPQCLKPLWVVVFRVRKTDGCRPVFCAVSRKQGTCRVRVPHPCAPGCDITARLRAAALSARRADEHAVGTHSRGGRAGSGLQLRAPARLLPAPEGKPAALPSRLGTVPRTRGKSRPAAALVLKGS